MSDNKKFKPQDSEQDQKENGQAAESSHNESPRTGRRDMPNPAEKRKYSEQPPTKRNTNA